MKRWLSSLILAGMITGTIGFINAPIEVVQAQSNDETTDLFYTFYGQTIPLSLQSNIIAVEFQETVGTRGSRQPNYLQLQQALEGVSFRGRTRGGDMAQPIAVEVKPLGDRYALVTIPEEGTRSTFNLEQQIRQQSYVTQTLPVLRAAATEDNESVIVLPNEIIVSFEPNLSTSQVQMLLHQYQLDIIRPLQFTQNRYLVRSRRESGTAILSVANRLNGVAGIQAASPNFIQSLHYRVQTEDVAEASLSTTPNAITQLQQTLASLPALKAPFQSDLLPLAWHLNSTPRRGNRLPRTDIRATEAWEMSNGGEETVVAVIDSVLQWDHPDLIENVHTLQGQANPLPGETHGWDFTSNTVTCQTNNPNFCIPGDPDTRLSNDELATLQSHFQNTFRLSPTELMQTYAQLASWVQLSNPQLSVNETANVIRNMIRNNIAAEFHGTWSAGVIAAHSPDGRGTLGVAPKAEILPVRVFGLGGEVTTVRLIEAIGYAADRGADVINMSLGGVMLDQALADQIFQVLDAHPNLVIVASAGNDSLDGVSFPAATPGVLAVGATNLEGNRTFYSSFGSRLDVVAPGGETSLFQRDGILTTGGMWQSGFWENMEVPDYAWGMSLDPLGYYVQVQGTSFSAPAVSGVVALMKGVNPDLERDRLINIIRDTASYNTLTVTQGDRNRYRLQQEVGLTQMQDRLSGIFSLPEPVSAEQYFFGYGLVNAAEAVRQARR